MPRVSITLYIFTQFKAMTITVSILQLKQVNTFTAPNTLQHEEALSTIVEITWLQKN